MPRASFATVGCKLNAYESDALRHQFAQARPEGCDGVPAIVMESAAAEQAPVR